MRRAPAPPAILRTAPVDCPFTAAHQHVDGSPFILPERGLDHAAAGQHPSFKWYIRTSVPCPSPVLRTVREAGPSSPFRGSRGQERPVLQADALVLHGPPAAEVSRHQLPPLAPGQPAVRGFLYKGLPPGNSSFSLFENLKNLA